MQPILFDKFRELLRIHGVDAVRTPETLVDQDPHHNVYYVPFEHVNNSAQLVLVGITPGPTQIAMAYGVVQQMLQNKKPDDEVLAAVKSYAAFGGPTMRPNLLRMLNAFNFSNILGIENVEELWGNSSELLHATSVVPHAAFVKGKPFAGSFDAVLESPALRNGFERDFIPSLSALNPNCHFIGLGPTPLAALDWCVKGGYLQAHQVLGAFSHPSSNGGSQVDVYLGLRDPQELSENDPVRSRVNWLLTASQRMSNATRNIGMNKVPLTASNVPISKIRIPKTLNIKNIPSNL